MPRGGERLLELDALRDRDGDRLEDLDSERERPRMAATPLPVITKGGGVSPLVGEGDRESGFVFLSTLPLSFFLARFALERYWLLVVLELLL